MRCLDGITASMTMSLRELQEIVKVRESWHSAVHRVVKSHNSSDLTHKHTDKQSERGNNQLKKVGKEYLLPFDSSEMTVQVFF